MRSRPSVFVVACAIVFVAACEGPVGPPGPRGDRGLQGVPGADGNPISMRYDVRLSETRLVMEAIRSYDIPRCDSNLEIRQNRRFASYAPWLEADLIERGLVLFYHRTDSIANSWELLSDPAYLSTGSDVWFPATWRIEANARPSATVDSVFVDFEVLIGACFPAANDGPDPFVNDVDVLGTFTFRVVAVDAELAPGDE